jgi:hypothetical protein
VPFREACVFPAALVVFGETLGAMLSDNQALRGVALPCGYFFECCRNATLIVAAFGFGWGSVDGNDQEYKNYCTTDRL